jgi:L-alanine-DL-glutamate epimerase-like enolase superfamily enzyme
MSIAASWRSSTGCSPASRAPRRGSTLALHDLVGKALNVPAYVLLGGKHRDMIPVASEIGIDTPEKMAENARTWCAWAFAW